MRGRWGLRPSHAQFHVAMDVTGAIINPEAQGLSEDSKALEGIHMEGNCLGRCLHMSVTSLQFLLCLSPTLEGVVT